MGGVGWRGGVYVMWEGQGEGEGYVMWEGWVCDVGGAG